MARRIREAGKQYDRVLVIAGGFHIWGLLHPEPAKEDGGPQIPRIARRSIRCATRKPAADALSGYASGMPAPAFYRKVWQQLHREGTSPAQAWDNAVLDTIVRSRPPSAGGRRDHLCL